MNDADITSIAAETLALWRTGRQIPPFSERYQNFTLADAYRVTPALRRLREARGEVPVGRKIGFTNRTIWAEYNVFAPVWGHVYAETLFDLRDGAAQNFTLAGLQEPRIEPEIVFGFGRAPAPGMDEAALLGCVDWVAHGFEIVHSLFPGWKFTPPDTVAGFGLHGGLLLGPRHAIAGDGRDWLHDLATFEISLYRDGALAATGRGADVLDSPLSALRHFNDLLAADPGNPPLAAGELVTTGTLTAALPCAPGERWSTELRGLGLEGIEVRFG